MQNQIFCLYLDTDDDIVIQVLTALERNKVECDILLQTLS